MASDAIRMKDLPRLATGGGGASGEDRSIASRVGEAMLDRLVEWVTSGSLPGSPTGGSPLEAVKDTLGVAKDLAGLEDSKAKRLREELEEAHKELRQLREMAAKQPDSTTELMKFFVELSQQANQRYMELIVAQQKEMRELLDRVYQDRPKSDEGEFFKQLGQQFIQAKLNEDPYESLEQQRERWYRRFEQERAAHQDLERWKWEKERELLERKAEREEERERRREERAERNMQQLMAAFQTLTAGTGNGQDHPAPHPQPDPSSISAIRGLSRYQCYKCGRDFILSHPAETVNCPYCGTLLQTTIRANGVPHESPAPAEGTS